MNDRIAIAETKKSSAGSEDFDRGSKWVLLESDTAKVEPTCEEPTLLDPSSIKYGDGMTIVSNNKVLKMDYSSKIVQDEFVAEALQPKSLYYLLLNLKKVKVK